MNKVNKKIYILIAVLLVISMVLAYLAIAFSAIPNELSVFEDSVAQSIPAPFVLKEEDKSGNCHADLFGFIPIKSVQVSLVPRTKLTPCGIPFGVKLFTDGVMVVGMSDIVTDKGSVNPAKNAGMKIGDLIVKMNGKQVRTNEDVAAVISKSKGKPIEVRLIRDGVEITCNFVPVVGVGDGKYKAGLWVRDSTAGIGTMTFVEEGTGRFGGLGHGICDVDTGAIMPMLSGTIVSAQIDEIVKGKKGVPGELVGTFQSDIVYGSLISNTEEGIFGVAEENFFKFGEPLEVASASEIKEGKATILCTLEGKSPKEYEIEIVRVLRGSGKSSKNMVIRVTDPILLQKTGGIVQGMSGSPIIQNGRLIGAVTHVLVGDPTSGFGIFIENMLSSMNKSLR